MSKVTEMSTNQKTPFSCPAIALQRRKRKKPNMYIWKILTIILSIMFTLNLLLCVFNLLPFPPLDGSGVLPLLLKEEHALSYMNFINNSSFSFFGLFIAWNVFDKLFDPIHLMAINLLYPGAGYH